MSTPQKNISVGMWELSYLLSCFTLGADNYSQQKKSHDLNIKNLSLRHLLKEQALNI